MTEVRRVYLDANVFIYAVEGEPDIADLMRDLFVAAERCGAELATSELTLAEVLVRPKRDRRQDRVRDFMDLLCFSRSVMLLPVTRDILIDSAAYSAVARPAGVERPDRRNFLADAIHVVSANRCGATAFCSQDRRIRLPDGMERVPLDPISIGNLVGRLG